MRVVLDNSVVLKRCNNLIVTFIGDSHTHKTLDWGECLELTRVGDGVYSGDGGRMRVYLKELEQMFGSEAIDKFLKSVWEKEDG